MTQIAFDGEVRLGHGERVSVAVLESAVEFLTHRFRRQVRDVPHHAGDADTRRQRSACAVVIAALPVRVSHDRVGGDRVPGDTLAGQAGSAGDRDARADSIGVRHAPFERAHAAERSAADRQELFDAKQLEGALFGPHHVAHGDHRELQPVGPARRRIDRAGAGRATARADQVGAHDVVALGVEGFAWPDHPVPPAEATARLDSAVVCAEAVYRAGCLGLVTPAGGVRVAAEGVADEDHVVLRRRESAVRFVGDAHLLEGSATVEPQRLGQIDEAGATDAGRPGRTNHHSVAQCHCRNHKAAPKSAQCARIA